MFIDRFEELNILQKKYAELSKGELIVIYGRRRVGKTELVRQFISSIEKSLYLYIDYATPREVLDIISNDVTSQSSDFVQFRDWDTFYSYLSTRGGIVIIDEFQRLFEIDKKAITRLQRFWDIELKEKPLMLILVGSSIGMMHNAVLSGTAPLYGRVTSTIRIAPLDYNGFREYFPDINKIKKVELFAIFGGTPYYLEFVKQCEHKDIRTILYETVLKKGAPLQNEPMNLLQMELKEVPRYNSILSAISSGKHSFREISDKSGIETNKLTYYLENLSRLLDITISADPVGGKKKSGRYEIKDNYFRFWYKFIFGNHVMLEVGNTEVLLDMVIEHISEYTGHTFEDIARELLIHYNGKKIKGQLITFSIIGPWWNRTGDEIDICAIGNKKLLLGEVKWTNRPVGCTDVKQLVKKSEMVQSPGEISFIFFSKSGFTEKSRQYMNEKNWIYLDLDDIEELYEELYEQW